jgi:hypothetical protein
MSALMLSVIPGVFAVMVGSGLGVDIITEDFAPIVWQCDHRIVYDDAGEPGRVSESGQELVERINNYAFEGEQVKWKVLVMDKNGIDKVSDVYVTLDGNKEANCDRLSWTDNNNVLDSCNARILEEQVDEWDSDTMAYYECTLTVETFDSMDGPYDVTVEAEDLEGLTSEMAEVERWFLNPIIELVVDGEDGGVITFDEVRPGTSAYSNNVLVGNDASDGSGVMLDMFISGTDFYDPNHSGAKCPYTNQLALENFRYYAVNGAYSTYDDPRSDSEGYVFINYGDKWDNTFYWHNEIIAMITPMIWQYYVPNILAPGAEMSLTFRLSLPEPCNGDFSDWQIYFWGEAI